MDLHILVAVTIPILVKCLHDIKLNLIKMDCPGVMLN